MHQGGSWSMQQPRSTFADIAYIFINPTSANVLPAHPCFSTFYGMQIGHGQGLVYVLGNNSGNKYVCLFNHLLHHNKVGPPSQSLHTFLPYIVSTILWRLVVFQQFQSYTFLYVGAALYPVPSLHRECYCTL